MRKLIILCAALTLSVGMWASNTITYTAEWKLTETSGSSTSGLHTNAFNVKITSHEFSNGVGTITFAGEVTTIGDDAFYDCDRMTSVTIPESVKTIGKYAFERCIRLTSVTIPNSVTTIGKEAFRGCSGLTSITIPNSVTTIGDDAFYHCSGLTSVTIPNSVTTIGDEAFYDCSGLTSIDVDATNTHYASVDGVLFNYAKDTLIQCPAANSRKEYSIPHSVTTIGKYAFDGCSSLTSVTIPNSVTRIGNGAFWGCIGLTSIDIPNLITTIGDRVFEGCRGFTSITIPISVKTIGYRAFDGCSNKNLKEITLPNSVEIIGSYAFANCSYLKTLTLGSKLEEIKEYAFQNDERLLYVNCYAEEPPLLQENAFDNYDIYLQVPCDVLDEYKVAKGWKLFNKENVSCISAEETPITTDDVTVVPADNQATFTWPQNQQAAGYSIEITKDGVVFCTLKFNGQGQLTGIAFALGRGGEQRTMPAAEMTTNGWQFTVTGLDQASKYSYALDALNAAQQSIKHYQGEFYTNGYTAFEQSTIDNAQGMVKMIIDGQVLIRKDGKTYNVLGQEVK